MLDMISNGFRAVREKLSGVTTLNEENLQDVLNEVRRSFLNADVEYDVTQNFLSTVKEKAIGQIIRTSAEVSKGGETQKVRIGPAERFIQICHHELQALMAAPGHAITFAKRPKITVIMMVGLQGAGKTTSTAKLARWLSKEGHRPLLVGADTQRPAAIDQLRTLSERLTAQGVKNSFFSVPGGLPVEICKKSLDVAKQQKCDVVLLDTAGRLAIDEALMQELVNIKQATQPHNCLLVVDGMMGQESVNTAKAFHERLALTGVVLSKMDGDARGGAALSIRAATGVPVRFMGLGEAIERFEEFRADGMAGRILGFGDVTALMRDLEGVIDPRKAEADARRLMRGQFSFDDFLEQTRMIQKMGPLKDVMTKMPGFSQLPAGINIDEKEIQRVQAMVESMTKRERNEPELFVEHPTRVHRVAKGSGTPDAQVIELIKRFAMMRSLMGTIGSQAGMLSKIPGMKQLAMAKQLRNAVQFQGLEDNPMLASLANELLEASVMEGGLGGLHAQGSGPHSITGTVIKSAAQRAAERNKKKNARKAQKEARKKSRRH